MNADVFFLSELCYLCHFDHLLGNLYVSLVVLSDFRYDEARIVTSDHPAGTQLKL